MRNKKPARLPVKGKLSDSIIEEICHAMVSLAESDLMGTRAWEDWARFAAEVWVKSHQQSVADGLSSSATLRVAMAAATSESTNLARSWATSWFGQRGESILAALPTEQEFSDAARRRALVCRPLESSEGQSAPEVASPEPAAADPSEFRDLVAKITEGAIERRVVVDTSPGERLMHGGSPVCREADKPGWPNTFAAESLRSMVHVRAVIAATALTVVQRIAHERARALSDTVARRLALDSVCGRLSETLSDLRESQSTPDGAKARKALESAGQSALWRDVLRDAAKVMDREGIRRLVHQQA